MSLTEMGEKIFKMKYSIGDETWDQMCLRVANHISMGDNKLLTTFYNMISERVFLPGGRVLANAGTGIKNLNNCFVLPVGDSRESIYGTLRDAAEIFAHGGGVGYNFSNVRETGAPIKSTKGEASGPLSFMSLFDQTGEVIQQASRRGAQMGILDIDHPDIEEFIHFKGNLNSRNSRLLEEYKRNLINAGLDKKGTKYFETLAKTLADDQLTHFNISVMLTDDFINATLDDWDWELTSRVTNKPVKLVKARDLLNAIAEQSWKSGDPGVAFFDRINEDNLVPYLGNLNCSNPCVTGDTAIHTVYEGAKSFKELADRGTDVLVYSWNPKTKLPVIRMMRNPRLTRKNVPILEIEFDSGLKVKCTYDHKFYTFRGIDIQAMFLKVGQSIRAFSMSEHKDGHYRIHGWSKNNVAKHQYVARLVWECFNGKIDDRKKVLHHKDFNPKNNKLENLQLITHELHNSIHYDSRKARGFYHRNHKIVSIKEAGCEDVYNGTVDETHTYIIADDKPVAGMASGIVSANCGEIFLLPYEPCCLGSINLHSCYDKESNTVNWEFLEFIVRQAVIFLDNVQTLSETPIEKVNYWSKNLRRLGLGVMGWADLLAEMEIPYDSIEALELAKKLSWFISYFGHLQSMALAIEKGPFSLYDPELVNLDYTMRLFNDKRYAPREFTEEEIRKIGFRNVAITSIAPTGTISLLANVNSAIEPFFALAYKRYTTEGVGNTARETFIEINPILFRKLEKSGLTKNQIQRITSHVMKYGTIQDCPEILDNVKAAFKVASEIKPIDHIRMQAAWQEFVDNSISKTINLPEDASVTEVAETILEMWNLNLKGGTIYRDKSKLFQILNKGV